VRRIAALSADEPFEEAVEVHRIDGGDTEHEADGGVGGGSPPLADDVLFARPAHDVPDGEEVVGEAEFSHELQFTLEELVDFEGDLVVIKLPGMLPRDLFQEF